MISKYIVADNIAGGVLIVETQTKLCFDDEEGQRPYISF